MRHLRTRGRVGLMAALIAAVLLPLAVACGDEEQATSTPKDDTASDAVGSPGPAGAGFLLAADYQAEKLYVLTLPDMTMTGQIDGIRFGNHNGALVLEDGRILFADDRAGELVALRISDKGVPQVIQRTGATLGAGAIWSSVSPDGKYWAVSGGIDDTREQPLNIVDLASFTNARVNIPMADGEELHPYLTDDLVVVGGGAELRAWKLTDALRGVLGTPVSTVAVAKGAHGLVTQNALKRLYLSTNDGLEGVALRSGALGDKAVIPWSVDGLSGGKNARPRLTSDGGYVLGAVSVPTPPEAERWAEREQHLHAANLSSGTARRTPLGKGLVTRFQLSAPYAMFLNITGAGDQAIFVHADPKSPAFLTVAGRVPLGTLSGGPTPGVSASGKETRSGAITADGRWAFVSHGGESKISVIDTETLTVVKAVTVPSPMKAGGYLLAYQPGQRLWDLNSR